AVLDRAEITVEVEDADRDRARTNDLHRPRRELIHRSHVDEGHYLTWNSSSRPAHSCGRGGPFARCSAAFKTPRPSTAPLMRIGALFGIPTSSSSSSLESSPTCVAVRPLTISVSIDVAAWLIAPRRPENLISSIVSPSSSNAT